VLDRATGRVAAGNPAGRRRLAGYVGSALSRRLADLATAAGHPPDTVSVRTWREEESGDGLVVDRRVRVLSLPIEFRSRECLLVTLRYDVAAPMPLPVGAGDGVPGLEHRCAAFTLDTVGRVDSWGSTPQRVTGHRAEYVIGAETTLLHPAPGRLAGDHHQALNHAYRTGEHRTEGWRMCADGGLIWAEVTTTPLYDAVETLLGFAQVIHDLTPVRRLHHRRGEPGRGEPGRRSAAAGPGSLLPGPRSAAAPPPGGPTRGPRRPAGRIPTQRRPRP
jgi:PAS domain S-box-containing protein